MTSEARFNVTPQLVIGVFVALLGILFTLDNLGYTHAEDYFQYWPTALIAVGLAKLLQAGRTGGWWVGTMFVVAGAWLLLDNLEIIDVSFADYWPLLLVLFGIHLVWQAATRGRSAASAGAESTINALAVMGGVERRSAARDFRGGELTAIMGGCEIDLTQATIASGDAVVNVFAMWGGIEIRVPEDCAVIGRVFPLMGAFEDKTRPPKNPTQRLIVKGVVIMGGVEVKN